MITFDQLCQSCSDVTRLPNGGQKTVFKAIHPTYGKVVIKICHNVADPRIAREIDIAKNYDFDCVPKLFETGDIEFAGGYTNYIIEEFIEGDLLRDRIRRGERFSISQVVSFLEQGLTMIAQLELANIVHRDIKPENIIISGEGRVYFLDFGIARILDQPSLTDTSAFGGPNTPGYSAPEQFNNLKKDIDSRTDIFSLGVVAYECLSGTNPFRDGAINQLDILQRTITISPVEFTIEGDSEHQLMAILSSMMGKTPSRRPNNATQAQEWLAAAKATFVM